MSLSNKFLLFLLCVLPSTFLLSQTPCNSGTAGDYNCNEVNLLSKMPLGLLGGGNGSDIWGYASGSGREFAIMGRSNGTAFVDISDPINPVLVGTLASHVGSSSWRDIRERNGYAFIGADAINGHGIQVFDLNRLDEALDTGATLPITFTEDAHTDFGSNGRSHNMVTNLNPNSDYLYAVGQRQYCSGGVTVFDISNPLNPIQGACFSEDGYSHDMICVDYRGPDETYIGQEVCIGFNESLFSIIDMTDKSNITGISSNSYNGVGYTHQGWITDDHKYLLLDDELDERNNNHQIRTYIFDISDLENPISMGYYEHPYTTIDHNMFVVGPYLYQANYEAGLIILDISDVANNGNITEAAYFDILPSSEAPNFRGAWGTYPFLPSGNILVSGISNVQAGVQTGGLFVLQPNLPHHLLSSPSGAIETVCSGEEAIFTYNREDRYGFTGSVSYQVEGLPSGVNAVVSTPTSSTVTVSISNTELLNEKTHFVLKATPNNSTPPSSISGGLIVRPTSEEVSLISPLDNTNTSAPINTLIWIPDANADSYIVEIAKDAQFSAIVETASDISGNQYTTSELPLDNTYYWRVKSVNECGTATSSSYSFRISSSSLPVTLLSFEGEASKKGAQLRWETNLEVNNAGFELQRADAIGASDFEKIALLEGRSPDGATYAYLDEKVRSGKTYLYRLKQIDFDGYFSYSPVINISMKGINNGLDIFPNPVTEVLNINLFRDQLTSEVEWNVEIIDLSGKILYQSTVSMTDSLLNTSVPVRDLSQGMYIINLQNEDEVVTEKFLKL